MITQGLEVNAILTVLVGTLCIATGVIVFTHEILLNPDRPNYPSAKTFVRILMFGWSGGLIYRGTELITLPSAYPPLITNAMVFTSCCMFAVHAVLLYQHMQMWLPARVQAKFKAMREIVTCSRLRQMEEARRRANAALRPGVVAPRGVDAFMAGAALADMEVDGSRVLQPDAPPSAVVH